MDDILAWAHWLWKTHDFALFTADHPGNPECVGAHHPNAPCDGGRGKHPCGKWSREATRDPAKLRRMFSRGLRNIAVPCKANNLLIVDEDVKGAYEVFAVEVGATIAETFTVATAKGFHRYYWQPEGIELGNGVGALKGRGIDVRGARGLGGYVIGPGSVHESGVIYQPLDPAAPILSAPAWLVEALQARPAPTARPTPRTTSVKDGGLPYRVLTGLVQTVLDATVPTASTNGDRNMRLFWAGCRMYEHAGHGLFDPAAGRAALLEAARRMGMTDGSAEATLDSAARNAGGRW
ncbi:bifunctional DNA primase/polymerase [Nonomuraea endophytica]|uniref:bifunctional DNA primase/polymerase n=1 Tax=Nonomuraea endophytica TaxID=714136 RepID=UPI0037C730A9